MSKRSFGHLYRFVASEIWSEIDSRDSAHRNFSRYVQLLAEHFLDLNREEEKRKKVERVLAATW